MGEIHILSKKIDFGKLVSCFKDESGSRDFLDVKGPLAVYRNIENGYITLEKAEENFKKLNQI